MPRPHREESGDHLRSRDQFVFTAGAFRADDCVPQSLPIGYFLNPIFRSINQVGTNWISLDVPTDNEEVFVVLDRKAFESGLIVVAFATSLVKNYPRPLFLCRAAKGSQQV